MFCPKCGGEYREGFTRCGECDAALLDAPAAEAAIHPELGDTVSVFSTGDPVTLMTAKSLLDDAGIPYLTRNEALQNLFGMGQLGTGFNLVAGPMEVLVGAQLRRLERAGASLSNDLG